MTSSSKPGTAALGLFSGQPQAENFGRIADFFEIDWIEPSTTPRPFPHGDPITLSPSYSFDGQVRSTDDFIESTETAALLIVKNGEIRFEEYWLTGGPDVEWISWSMAKSFTSALVGIAVREGAIPSLAAPVTDYVPSLAGTAYDTTTIQDVLQMSSGARWNEDFSDPDADIHRFVASLAYQGTQAEVMQTTGPEHPPGTRWAYNTCDTQAAAMVLTAATGQRITDYMAERLCPALGLEHRCGWILDAEGMEMAGGGILMTARDYAKFGELFRVDGHMNGHQIIPAAWVDESTRPMSPQVEPGRLEIHGMTLPYGYGYQWWLPSGEGGELEARGVYNQSIWIDKSNGVVIVKLSANRRYGTSPAERDHRGAETIAFLRHLSQTIE